MHPALTFQFERAVNEYAQWQAVPAEDRSDAPAWWWSTAIDAIDESPPDSSYKALNYMVERGSPTIYIHLWNILDKGG